MKTVVIGLISLLAVVIKLYLMTSLVDFKFTSSPDIETRYFPEVSFWVEEVEPTKKDEYKIEKVKTTEPLETNDTNIEIDLAGPRAIELEPDEFALPTGNNGLDIALDTPKLPNINRYQGLTADSVFGTPVRALRPRYPPYAQRKKIEGYVIVSISVSEGGTVSRDSIEIVKSFPRGVFDRAVISVASKLKFKPKIVDGVPQAASGVLFLYKFDLSSEDNLLSQISN